MRTYSVYPNRCVFQIGMGLCKFAPSSMQAASYPWAEAVSGDAHSAKCRLCGVLISVKAGYSKLAQHAAQKFHADREVAGPSPAPRQEDIVTALNTVRDVGLMKVSEVDMNVFEVILFAFSH